MLVFRDSWEKYHIGGIFPIYFHTCNLIVSSVNFSPMENDSLVLFKKEGTSLTAPIGKSPLLTRYLPMITLFLACGTKSKNKGKNKVIICIQKISA